MKTKLVKLSTLVFCMLAALPSLAAANGDIYEIRPCTKGNVTIPPKATIETPIKSGGVDLYFRLRLLQRTKGAPEDNNWKLVHVGLQTEAVDWVSNPLQIGIYVSGQLRYATLVSSTPSATTGFTDLIFKYTTRVGDFALPIVLATAAGAASDMEAAGSSYLLNNLYDPETGLGAWRIANADDEDCNFWQCTPAWPVPAPETDGRNADTSLANCGFFVQTIDFDADSYKVPESNVELHSLVAASAIENEVTLKVWSMDESKVKISGGTTVMLNLDEDGTSQVATQVGYITIAGGAVSANFKLLGVAEDGTAADLVLSAWDNYNYSKGTGARIIDYITVPVTCSEPLPPAVAIASSASSIYADSDWKNFKAKLLVYLTQPVDEKLSVTITPEMLGLPAGGNVGDYVKFHKNLESVETVSALSDTVVVEIPKNASGTNDTNAATVYVYAFRGDQYSSGAYTVDFKPSISAAQQASTGLDPADFIPAAISVRAANPVITAPATLSATALIEKEIEIAVSDTWAGQQIASPADGYKITVQYDGPGDTKKELDGDFYITGGVLKDKDGKLPKLTYSLSGEYETYIYVTEPINKLDSAAVIVNATVADANKIYITSDVKQYNEGDVAEFTVYMNNRNSTGGDIYLFLKPSTGITKGMLSAEGGDNFIVCSDTDYAETRGIKIASGDGNIDNPAKADVRLLDGKDVSAGGLQFSFEAVLCKTENYDDTQLINDYTSGKFAVKVLNLEPAIKRIEMNGFESEGNGYQFSDQPKGMPQTFKAIVTDKGTYDLSTGFQTKWTTYLNGKQKTATTKDGNPNLDANAFTYTFTQKGTWEIRAQIKDKDMEDWSETDYRVVLEVLDQPSVVLTVPDSIEESDNKAEISVGLSYWDPDYDGELTVRITVSEYSPGRVNPGSLKLDSQYATGTENVYELDLDDVTPVSIPLDPEKLDGTEISDTYGFTVKAEIVTATALPTSGEAASDYYLPSTVRTYVVNTPPVFGNVTPGNDATTNVFAISGGVATQYPIRWQVRRDVDLDWAEGITVEFFGCDNAAAGAQTIYEPRSGVFTPDFGSAQGSQMVTMTISDKDGGEKTWTYYYKIEPSKFLTVKAVGPAGGTTTAPQTMKYANAKGLGEGHAWVDGATLNSVANFAQTWNCSKDYRKDIYAWGYKVGAVDNGLLDANDIAIDPDGNAWTAGDYYAYSDPDLDSFFYTWVKVVQDNNGAFSSSVDSLAPEQAEAKKPGVGYIGLPTATFQDGGYPETMVDAIFSKEYLASDNCGDINQDGIPDRHFVQYGFGLYDNTSGEQSGNDLTNLAGYNEDGDYLPANNISGLALVPDIKDNWPTQGGLPFTALLEIRGFGEGLNTVYGDIDFTEDEKRAYLLWRFEQDLTEVDPAKRAEAISDEQSRLIALGDGDVATEFGDGTQALADKWSPENPTDPTMEDTDADQAPDGYEYWFWYGAKVGYRGVPPEGGEMVWTGRMHGKRLNLDDVEVFDDIAPDEICEAFDPNVPALGYVSRDFDSDGLFDYEEFLIGTNPVMCDTDGDRLPDGWEVMFCLNPLSNEDAGVINNPDNDFMAETTAFTAIYLGDKVYLTGRNLTGGSAGYEPFLPNRPYAMGSAGTGETMSFNGATIYRSVSRVQVEFTPADLAAMVVSNNSFSTTPVTLVHDQVYNALGFDPRTAWFRNITGYVHNRWDPSFNPPARRYGDTGFAVNTRRYTTYDEYIFYKYYTKVRGMAVQGNTVLEKLRAGCTNPNTPVAEKNYGDSGTVYSVPRHGADTNDDGVPDGWEIYVGLDPIIEDPIPDGLLNNDSDSLANCAEFAGLDSCFAYADANHLDESNTIKSYDPGTGGWLNKFFPTDPNDADTDGDGVNDDDEGGSYTSDFFPWYAGRDTWTEYECFFVYPGAVYDEKTLCFRGGGMNPCNSDTDFDGLPDAWERQYAGIVFNADFTPYVPGAEDDGATEESKNEAAMYTDELKIADGFSTTNNAPKAVGCFVVGGMDPTYADDARTMQLDPDPRTGTARDFDFDHDGLENWQEYLTQAVRHWRYDDAETPLMGRAIIWTGNGGSTRLTAPLEPLDLGCLKMNVTDGARFYNTVKSTNIWSRINTGDNLYYKYYDYIGKYPYDEIGYFDTVKYKWDPTRFLGKKIMLAPGTVIEYPNTGDTPAPVRVRGTRYASTDPRRWDTDNDGMDDFYETFHGLNPLLGGSDIVMDAYFGTSIYWAFHADFNAWTGSTVHVDPDEETIAFGGLAIDDPGYDPLRAPWRMGLAEADPDGDGLRNADEAIMGDMTSPTTYHTDPSPLWFTDRSTPISYVSQYYVGDRQNSIPFTTKFEIEYGFEAGTDVMYGHGGNLGAAEFVTFEYPLAFEENEGFDTDGDFRGDGHEIVKSVGDMSDPLDANSPDRRAAIWFSGNNSCAVSYEEGNLPVVDSYDMFRQFTVELWFKAEDIAREQTLIERGFAYPALNYVNSNEQWRANFCLAINEGGVLYGMFDNDNAVESGSGEGVHCQTVTGGEIEAGRWTHVAMTFDGFDLTMYVDGVRRQRARTNLIPANGIVSLLQNPARDLTVTNSFPASTYETLDGAITLGARRSPDALEWDWSGDFGQLTDFFKGYVSEVRLWDGARTENDIIENYKKIFSSADIKDNAEVVYSSWRAGGTRNNNDGAPNLPAQLIVNYNFGQIPGAVDPGDVAVIPSGFDFGIYDNFPYDSDLIKIGWWDRAENLHSTVYTDYHVVPWIQNSVARAPLLDDSVSDSMYWANHVAGYTPDTFNHVTSYAIPNSGNPYIKRNDVNERTLHFSRLFDYCPGIWPDDTDREKALDLAWRYAFSLRSNYNVAGDLVPLGDAYAKRSADYWDGSGSMSAWTDTRTDTDGDDLPDWWEDYARANYGATGDVTPTTAIDYDGDGETDFLAFQAYILDLHNKGMLPSGPDDAYRIVEDKDGDSLPDWWEEVYGVYVYGPDDDPDNDGLSNYAEYMVSFGDHPYGATNDWPVLDPMVARSGAGTLQLVTDYFLRGPDYAFDASGRHIFANEYLGGIFTDHDFVEDWWERDYSLSYANSRIYDPYMDADGDGWDNYSECRAALWSGLFSADLIERFLADSDNSYLYSHPRPAIGLRITYNGRADISTHGITVRTQTNGARADAVFRVDGSSILETDYDAIRHTKIIGAGLESGKMRGFLTPGSVTPGDVSFNYVRTDDRVFTWRFRRGGNEITTTFDGYTSALNQYGSGENGIVLVKTSLDWKPFASADSDALGMRGDIYLTLKDYAKTKVGTIDYRTGEYCLDFDRIAALGIPNITDYIFRCDYAALIGESWPQTVWLADPETGRVRQGINTIEAFVDLDGDGALTAGEPYGFARNVNIGWHRTCETTIELFDASGVMPVLPLMAADEQGSAGAQTVKMEIRRRSINGNTVLAYTNASDKADGKVEKKYKVPTRSQMVKTFVLDDRAYVTPADVLSDAVFDLDWRFLAKDIQKMRDHLGNPDQEISTVEYTLERIVDLPDGTTTNIVVSTFNKRFNTQPVKPVAVSPVALAPVYSASPTFAWTSSDDTMTAFRLQVSTSTNTADVIYDSGVRQLPGRGGSTPGSPAYRFTAPVYVDAPVGTNGAPVLADVSNYYWRVVTLNAKFSEPAPAYWSAWTPFQMDVANENRYPRLPTGYGNCAAAVRYYGPYTNDLTNLIVVEAHETADFCGQPLAQTRVGDLGKLSDIGDISTTNAVMRGVAPGTVYLMAYLDLNNNGRRDANESWGYANQVGTGHRALYTPAGVEVSDSLALYPSVAIFIEDTDVNKNEIPDCLEAGMPGIGGAGDGADGDIDRDGLIDSDEEGLNADSAKWDTDGDGMPDGWEVVIANLDPRNNDAYEFTQDENKALDVMAFATNRCTIVTVKNTAANAEPVKYILKPGQPIPRVGDDAGALALYETFEYPVAGEDENGDPVTTRCCGRGKEATLVASEGTSNLVYEVSTDTEALVHAQVYKEYGFNPKTAVVADDAVNTKPFTALDKYLVIRYFDALGICDEDSVNVNREWAKYSLKPNEIDGDRDGVADGWELYVMFGPNPMTKETFEAGAGSVNSPWNYADRAKDLDGESLDLVGEFDRGSWPTDPWDVDTDKDGIDDATAVRYHIKGTEGDEDNDGDGLSNFVEYLLAEVIKDDNDNHIGSFDPDDAFSVNDTADIGDYFFKVGQLYVGDVFADHDRMDDSWEGRYDIDAISRYIYDANLDPDRDGWSNYAEFQAGTDPTRLGSLGIDGVQMNEYPVPTIELKLNYNGRQNVSVSPIVVKAWRDRAMSTIPDAQWTIGSGTNETEAVKYLGVNPNRETLLHLSPGSIVPNSVKFGFKDTNWVLYDRANNRYWSVAGDSATWEDFVIDRARTDSSGLGDILQRTTDTVIGEIDYRTGAAVVDFTKLSKTLGIGGDISGSAGAGDYMSIYTLASSYVRVSYRAKPVVGGNSIVYYLADPDAPSADNNSLGHVKEGENVFVAFWDLDANGYYNAGEPYGFTDGVDVGWNGAKAEIELSDTSPIFARVNCSETYLGGDDLAANDKNSLYGSASGNYDIDLIVKGVTSGGKYERVRVVRTLVDGVGVSAPSRNIEARVVLDKWIDTDYEPYITEADFLRNGEFDVDWSDLASDISKAGYNGPVTSVVYRIVLGNGDASALATNNLLQVGINKSFDIQKAYNDSMPPVALGPAEVNTPSPTFTWAINNGLDSYTAFKLKIYDAGGRQIWDSGYRRMPAREKNATYGWQYSWTAPISVGDRIVGGDVFANATNYTWSVSVYNAKYKTDKFSAKSAFRMNVRSASMDYGTANVAVKYFGPDLVRNSGVIRVQAFETPDFAGVPAAAGYVADAVKPSVASASSVEANATIVGLKPGTYYIRAFIDTNGNGRCDEWESWGFHCVRDTAGATLYTPVSVRVGPEIGESMTIDVYIDDSDTDQDNLPDAWEFKQRGNLTSLGVDSLDQSPMGYDMKKSITQAMTAGGPGSSGLAVRTSRMLGNAYIAAMLGDADDPAGLPAPGDADIKEGSIVISSISLDTAARKISLVVDADVETRVSAAFEAIYEIGDAGTAVVKCKILKKNTLMDSEWAEVAEKSIIVGREPAEIDVDIGDGVDLSTGFFKVVLE